ncbi:uncharacterized protein SPSK_08188 [Sporothrix schenckii 1099-18]|uniref:Uncharacterized protein n=1 Tax=Sporothrix schenckii 1099-18 TaxID=1397361 RepID=A0A0F2MJU6_SPOSC|nr:uncharacterized protein SPSK_08188 [Sporothrix schenckii 1099-18]KJR88441.1 hypothetical protein SPSK_08188 [Sporothrix schenckii 1099-18]
MEVVIGFDQVANTQDDGQARRPSTKIATALNQKPGWSWREDGRRDRWGLKGHDELHGMEWNGTSAYGLIVAARSIHCQRLARAQQQLCCTVRT